MAVASHGKVTDLHPTCRSEFTRVHAGEEVQDHVDIVITDYETDRVMDGDIYRV